MSPPISRPIDFRKNSQSLDPQMIAAIQQATARLNAMRAAAVASTPEWQALRQTAHDLRRDALAHSDELIAQVERQVAAAGGQVHRARDAAQANALVVAIARQHRVATVVKAKSMVSEEIGLNRALEQAGVRVFETDVGEYIIQLAGAAPSHILGPAMHLTKEQIAQLFTAKLGVVAPPDPRRLTEIARAQLRDVFLRAEMGITGANFIVAETGTVALVTNEGNGRLCTTLPDVHVVIAGIDKLVPDWNALAVLLPMLVRSATGQNLSACTSFITGVPRADGQGPREFHLILLDNGRAKILADPAVRETLLCIRCAACLNVCPVYNQVGGHAYGWVYSGPIGAILSPQLLGTRLARDLPYASTLCGACADVCPVKLPIPEILLQLRQRIAEGDHRAAAATGAAAQLAARAGAFVLGRSFVYRWSARLARRAQFFFRRGEWLPNLPPPLQRWTRVRPFPAIDATFRAWWKQRTGAAPQRLWQMPKQNPPSEKNNAPAATLCGTAIDQLIQEINRLGGKARRIEEKEIGPALEQLVQSEKIKRAALWATPEIARLGLGDRLRAAGVALVPLDAAKSTLAQVDLGITEVDFALPASGTLALLATPQKPRALSLLPQIHLALVQPRALRATLREIFDETKHADAMVFLTGLSRTSDIESKPVLGAHGPRALYVWVVV